MDSAFPDFSTSQVLARAGFRHAFFTRRGGVSEGPYASLNFSAGSGDARESVERNLELAASALSVPSARILFLSQVHGAKVAIVSGSEDRSGLAAVSGDAIASRSATVALAVRVADCVPILAGDRRSGAAVAIHAGWRGLVSGVVEAGIAALRGLAGGDGELVVAIGPHIAAPAFEVSEEVAAVLDALAPGAGAVERSFGPKPHVSLERIVRAKLSALGVAAPDVEVVPGCTHADPIRFFSFRRDGKASGRHLCAIIPRARG